jgi:hypothetical protein
MEWWINDDDDDDDDDDEGLPNDYIIGRWGRVWPQKKNVTRYVETELNQIPEQD